MKIQLFLNNEEVELLSDVQFPITKQFEDLQNPTSIINDWSKSVSIPFSNKNHEIFKDIFRTDFVITSFDPTKKIPMKLLCNNELILDGYAKLNTIKQKEGKGSYEINLFGKLGEIFAELKQLSPVKTDEVGDNSIYYIGNIGGEPALNRELVYRSWNYDANLNSDINNAAFTDVFGFACTNSGYNDEFQSDSYEHVNSAGKSEEIVFKDTLPEDKYAEAGIDRESAVGDGLLPRAFGEYRSYYQVPFIYVPRMFDILKTKCKQLTDYTLELDQSWFNSRNPFYKNLVMTLQRPERETKQASSYYSMGFFPHQWQWTQSSASVKQWYLFNISNNPGTRIVSPEVPDIVGESAFGDEAISLTDKMVTISMPVKLRMILEPPTGQSAYGTTYMTNDFCMKVEVQLMGANNKRKTLKKFAVCSPFFPAKYQESLKGFDVDKTLYVPKLSEYAQGKYEYDFEFSVEGAASAPEFGEYAEVQMFAYLDNTNPPMVRNKNTAGWKIMLITDYNPSNEAIVSQGKTLAPASMANSTVKAFINNRSNMPVKLEYMWDPDANFFGEILKYTKMFNLVWKCDTTTKTITCKSFANYFSMHPAIEDWTNKLDMSRDYEISPIIYDKRYYKLNYEDSDDALNSNYKTNYGVNFGELKLKTKYDFNNDSKDYFEDIKTSIVSTESFIGWNHLHDCNIQAVCPNEPMPHFADKENASIDTFGSFFFHNGRGVFDTGVYGGNSIRTVYITDDTDFQIQNQKFMYSDNTTGNKTRTEYYPALNIANDDFMCLFNKPSKTYDYTNNYANKIDIFEGVWTYLVSGERLNPDTHKLTCYLHLTPNDYKNFDFNKLITINNQLYMINKITDYNFSNISTKCELIKINDIRNYTENRVNDKIDVLEVSGGVAYFDYSIIPTQVNIGVYYSIRDVVFTKTGTTYYKDEEAGLEFELKDGQLLCKTFKTYSGKDDINVVLEVTNGKDTANFYAQRYSLFPYPYIELRKNGTSYTDMKNLDDTITLRWVGIENPRTEPNFQFKVDNSNWVSPTTGVNGILVYRPTWRHSTEQDMIAWGDDNETFYFDQWECDLSITRDTTTGLNAHTLSFKIVDGDYGVENTLNLKVSKITDSIDAHALNNLYVDYTAHTTYTDLAKYDLIRSVSDVTFSDGSKTKTFSSLGLTLKIVAAGSDGDVKLFKIQYTSSIYTSKDDVEETITVKNVSGATDSFKLIRYSVYPYPNVTFSKSILTGASGSFEVMFGPTSINSFQWIVVNGTTVNLSSGKTTDISSAGLKLTVLSVTNREQMYSNEKGDEWFLNEKAVLFGFTRYETNSTSLTFDIKDYDGMRNTKALPVSSVADNLTLSFNSTNYNWQFVGSEKLCAITSVTEVKFGTNWNTGTSTYSDSKAKMNFEFRSGYLYVTSTAMFSETEEYTFQVPICNKSQVKYFTVKRYEIYPYPRVAIEDENHSEITSLSIEVGETKTIYARLWLYNDDLIEKYKSVKPSITVGTLSRGVTTSYNTTDWVYDESMSDMFQDGDYETFANYSWVIPISVTRSNSVANMIAVKITHNPTGIVANGSARIARILRSVQPTINPSIITIKTGDSRDVVTIADVTGNGVPTILGLTSDGSTFATGTHTEMLNTTIDGRLPIVFDTFASTTAEVDEVEGSIEVLPLRRKISGPAHAPGRLPVSGEETPEPSEPERTIVIDSETYYYM